MLQASTIPPSDELRPETTQFQCPVCGRGCYIGFRALNGVTFGCRDHGRFYSVDGRGRIEEGVPPAGVMNPEERLWLIDTACRILMGDRSEGNFLIVQSATLECNYVMARVLGGNLRVEVCSREWGCDRCGDRPLSFEALHALTAGGFTIPGPHENPQRWVPSMLPRHLAVLLERSLILAYGEPADFEVTMYMARQADMGALADSLSVPAR